MTDVHLSTEVFLIFFFVKRMFSSSFSYKNIIDFY